MTRSGSGWPEVYRLAAMWSTSSTSASSSMVVPDSACCNSSLRTASAISCRPPYPIATLSSSPGRPCVRAAAAESLSAMSPGNSSRAPTTRSRQRADASDSSSTTSVMIFRSGSSSSAGRSRLSVDRSHSVTTSTPASSHHSRRSAILAAPARWPSLTSTNPASRAHRRLPSSITATCRGRAAAPASSRLSFRSYTEYSRSRTPTAEQRTPRRSPT
jgi:hypothetical protein